MFPWNHLNLTLKWFGCEIDFHKINEIGRGGALQRAFTIYQPHITTTTPIFKWAMPYRRGDQGTSSEPINKPPKASMTSENVKNREKMYCYLEKFDFRGL